MSRSCVPLAFVLGLAWAGEAHANDFLRSAKDAPCACPHTGDVNDSGNLTSGDAQLAFMIAVGLIAPTPAEACRADVNGDGSVSAGDAQLVFLAALGGGSVPVGLPAGECCTAAAQCTSGHCQNGYCCAAGDCCGEAAHCPAEYAGGPTCDSPTTCQGTVDVAECLDAVCSTDTRDDDSACGPEPPIEACGLYADTACTGEPEQVAPSCAITCASDAACDAAARCTAPTVLLLPADSDPQADASMYGHDVSIWWGSPFADATAPRFGTASLTFPNIGDTLYVEASADPVLVLDDTFTIDFWVDVRGAVPEYSWFVFTESLYVGFYEGHFTTYDDAFHELPAGPSTSGWTHFAWVRDGSGEDNNVVYVDGEPLLTWTSTFGGLEFPVYIGDPVEVFADFSIDDFRFANGLARWTAAFSPPAAPAEIDPGQCLAE